MEHVRYPVGVDVQLKNRRAFGAEGALVHGAAHVAFDVDDLAIYRVHQVPQPTAQYGHTLGNALARVMRASTARATAGRRSAPRPTRPPSAVPALADILKKSRREISMRRFPRLCAG